MKKQIALTKIYSLIWLGEVALWIAYWKIRGKFVFDYESIITNGVGEALYNVYNYCMVKSADVQEKAGLNKPWKEVTKKEEEYNKHTNEY